MATDAVRNGSWFQNFRASVARTGPFLREVQVELRKVSWPDRRQLIEATRTIIIVVLVIAFLIFLMDSFFQEVLVTFIPSLFK
ncbi:MAG: preprotein translocase subunit SecE [Gemmatimonadaceae bacterium]